MLEKYQSCFISVTLKSWSGWKLLDPTTYLGYGLDNAASNSHQGQDTYLFTEASTTALRSTQTTTQWIPALFSQ